MNKYNNIFGQLSRIIPRIEFEEMSKTSGAEKGSKGFSCWDQFMSNTFGQYVSANSLREICNGLASSEGKLRHLGMKEAPKKSTLSYSNKHRTWKLYEGVFYKMLGRISSEISKGGKHKFRFKNKLLSFDASTIDLCLSMFDWAKFRRKKGAIKLHLLLDHAGYLPQYVNITDGNTHEVNILKRLSFESGTIIVMDRGLIDYEMYGKWTEVGVYFVTRLKSNAKYQVLEIRDLPQNRNVIRDEIIELEGFYSQQDCPHKLRIVEIWNAEKQETIKFLTNNLVFGATTIAAIYKDRWQIELFFKALKQNLRIKTFIGTSFNAVMIQIWSALICLLILKYLQARSKIGWSLSNLASMIRLNLLTYRDLWRWLDKPFDTPPITPIFEQYSIFNLGQQIG
jgi:hypothetical protein